MCELTHSADTELQGLPSPFKTEVNQSVTEVGERHSLHVCISAAINEINIPVVAGLMARNILLLNWSI